MKIFYPKTLIFYHFFWKAEVSFTYHSFLVEADKQPSPTSSFFFHLLILDDPAICQHSRL